jgi:hypothetical protein
MKTSKKSCGSLLRTAVASGVLMMPGLMLAGPLQPAVGPVVSTGKTLTSLEPRTEINASNTPGDANSIFRITQPGSYYVSGNIAASGARSAIEIAASNVTIDLTGFTLSSFITNDGAINNITIRNGTVDASFITLLANGADPADGCVIENVCFSNCTTQAIRVGDASMLRNVRILAPTGNFGGSIRMGDFATLTDVTIENRAAGNSVNIDVGAHATLDRVISRGGLRGIDAGSYARLRSCVVSGALSQTLSAINVGEGSTLIDCTATGNQAAGFAVGNSSRLIQCTAMGNLGGGFVSANANSVTMVNCAADGNLNEANIRLGGFAMISRTQVRAGQSGGIVTGAGARIDECSVVNNVGVGITVGSGTIASTQVVNSTAGGIVGGARTFVLRSTVNQGGNPGIGVLLDGTAGRIEDTAIFNCAIGYQTNGSGNMIVRNHFNANAVDGNNNGQTNVFGGFLLNSADLSDPNAPHGNYNP